MAAATDQVAEVAVVAVAMVPVDARAVVEVGAVVGLVAAVVAMGAAVAAAVEEIPAVGTVAEMTPVALRRPPWRRPLGRHSGIEFEATSRLPRPGGTST